MTRELTVPYNLPAERAVLGGLLQGAPFADVADSSLAADFYLQKHTIIYAAMRECQQRGVAVDIITVADVLKRRDELDMVGGMSFLAELMQEAAATSWYFNDHASVISRTATQRRAIEATGQAQAAIYNFAGEDPAKLAEHVLKIVSAPFQRVQARKRRLWLTEDEIDALPPVEFAIDGVIVKSGVTLIYGPSDSGKTFLVVDMAMRFAQHKRVLYCAGEDANGIRIRKAAWQQEYQRPANGNFLMWTRRMSLQDDDAVDEFIKQCQSAGVSMVIFDTLSQFTGGADENQNSEMARVMANAERIHVAIGGAVIVVHHTDKSGGNFRGAGAIKDNTYGCLSVYKDDDSIVMECIRIKNFRPWEPRRYRLKEVRLSIKNGDVFQDVVSCIPLPATQVEPIGDELTAGQATILNGVCVIAHARGSAREGDLQRYSRLEDRNFWSSLSRLQKAGYVNRQASPAGYVPTDKGKRYSRDQYVAGKGGESANMFGVTTTEGIDIIEIPRYHSVEGYDTPSEPQEPVTGATVRLASDVPTTQHLNELRAEWARLDTAIDQGYAKLSGDDAMVYNELQEGLETLLAGSEEYEALAVRFNEYAAIDNALGRVLAMQIRWGQIGAQLQEAT